MKKVQVYDLPVEHFASPHGRYRCSFRTISEELGCPRHAGVTQGGHPFDLEWNSLPAGAQNFPFHAHYNQWELFLFVSGAGEMRTDRETVPLGPGDVMLFAPGEAHQLRNTGSSDLIYYIVADNPTADVIHYPDTDKWAVRPPRKLFRMTEAPYLEPAD